MAWVAAGRRSSDGRARDSGLETSDRQPEPCHLPGVCHRGHSVSARDGGTGGRAGRQRARVRRDRVHGHATVVAETIRRRRQPPPRRDRWRCQPVLVARRALDRVCRARQALEDRTHRRPAAGRCATRSPMRYGTWNQRRHDPLQRLQSGNLPCLRERRERAARSRSSTSRAAISPTRFPCSCPTDGGSCTSRSEGATVSRSCSRAHSIRPRPGGWRLRKPTWASPGRYLMSLNKGVLVGAALRSESGRR